MCLRDDINVNDGGHLEQRKTFAVFPLLRNACLHARVQNARARFERVRAKNKKT